MTKAGILAMLLCVWTSGCAAALNVDPWATECPYRADQEWKGIPRDLVHLVPPQKMTEAEAALRDVPIVPLSQQAAENFAGQGLIPQEGLKFFLVRAVALNETNGGYRLSTREDSLWVHHQCMGSYPVWMKRRALVVQLSQEPRRVYVYCGMTQ
jgi:hypothetical protein